MFSFDKLVITYWCYRQERYLKSIEKFVSTTFNYFHNVRANNPLRQDIGLKDLTAHHTPFINSKHKESIIVGNSTYVLLELLNRVQKERKKLLRFKNIKINTTKTSGKVRFNNENKELSIKSF